MTTSTPHGAPELPFSPLLYVDWADRSKTQTLYTADQMREYARAAIQQAAGAVPEMPKRLDFCSDVWRSYDYGASPRDGYMDGWNDCLDEITSLLAASPSPLGREAACGSQNAESEPQSVLTRTDDPQREAGSSDHLVPCAVGGVTQRKPVGVLCISHFRDNPGMANVEYQSMEDLPPGQHFLYLNPEGT